MIMSTTLQPTVQGEGNELDTLLDMYDWAFWSWAYQDYPAVYIRPFGTWTYIDYYVLNPSKSGIPRDWSPLF